MKKVIVLITVSLFLITAATGCTKKDNSETKESSSTEKVMIEDETEQRQENLFFHDIEIVSYGASNVIVGKVKNEGDFTADFMLNLSMYKRETGTLLGTAQTKIEQLSVGEEKSFQVSVIGNYDDVDRFQVEVTDLVKSES